MPHLSTTRYKVWNYQTSPWERGTVYWKANNPQAYRNDWIWELSHMDGWGWKKQLFSSRYSTIRTSVRVRLQHFAQFWCSHTWKDTERFGQKQWDHSKLFRSWKEFLPVKVLKSSICLTHEPMRETWLQEYSIRYKSILWFRGHNKMAIMYWRQNQVLVSYKTSAFYWVYAVQYSFSHTITKYFLLQEASLSVQDSWWLFGGCFYSSLNPWPHDSLYAI